MVSVFLAVIAVAACQTPASVKLPAPVHVKSQDQAATVLVTASMVAPWATVSAALKPAFTMTGDAAVAEVLPTTEQIQSQVLSAFGASLGVGLPGSSTSSSSGQTSNITQGSNTTGGVTTTTASNNGTATSSTTTTTTPGVAPAPPTSMPAGGQLPTAPALTGGISLDPVLKYKAAAYLNQEVQLLNQEIDNAAVRECFVPYVVKLKLAVMNYRPYLAYSVHTRVSFASGSNGEYPPTNDDLLQAARTLRAAGLFGDIEEPSKGSDAKSSALSFTAEQWTRIDQATKALQSEHTSATCLTKNHAPIVVPFLVADDMEVALKSRATEAAQQIAFALNFMIHGVGGNAGVNNVNMALTAISSQDLSSALTVARDNDNTLYIHIAPNNQASGDPTLVGQTYDVAVLLLVPRRYFTWRGDQFDPARISLVSYTQFRDATSGEILPIRPAATNAKDLDRVLMPFFAADQERIDWWSKLSDRQKVAEAKPLMGAIVAGNPETFRENLDGGSACPSKPSSYNLCLPAGLGSSLWAGLSSVLSDNSYKSAMFEAPVPQKVRVPFQTVLVADDKTHPMQVLVGSVDGVSTATLAARLNVKTTSGGSVVTIPAQSLVLDTTAHVMTLTFPSLGKSGLSMPTKKSSGQPAPDGPTLLPDDCENALIIERVNCDPLKALCPELQVVEGGHAVRRGTEDHPFVALPVQFAALPKAMPTPIAKLVSEGNAISINRDSSSGVLPVVVSTPASGLPAGDTLALTVTGAPVVAALGSPGTVLSLGKNGYVLPQAGAYTIDLVNLTPGAVVTVSVQAIKADGKTPDGDPATASFTAIPSTVSRP